MLPAKIKPRKVSKKKNSFGRALERFRERNEPPPRAPVPPQAPVLSTVTTAHRCAETAKEFVIIWRRDAPDEQYSVHDIQKVTGGVGAAKGKAVQPRELDVSEFDYAKQYCPWCASRHGFLNCARCGETVCGARTEWHDSRKRMKCSDLCGWHGFVTDATRVRIMPDTPNKSAPSGKPSSSGPKALRHETRRALPNGKAGRLLPPRK